MESRPKNLVQPKKKASLEKKSIKNGKGMLKKECKQYEFTTELKRQQAMDGGSSDPLLSSICSFASQIFLPKSITHKTDWLVTHKESGQTVQRYSQGGPNINWVNQRNKTIYVLPIDESVDIKQLKFKLQYVKAFFMGIQVKLLKT